MNFITKSLRAIIPTAAGLALAISTTVRAETAMPETPSDVAAPPADAAKTASGLASKVLQAGKGDKKPAAADTVTVHYSGWTTDGKLFDSSILRNEPIVFPLNQVIPGWTEGVQLMVEGEKQGARRLAGRAQIDRRLAAPATDFKGRAEPSRGEGGVVEGAALRRVQEALDGLDIDGKLHGLSWPRPGPCRPVKSLAWSGLARG